MTSTNRRAVSVSLDQPRDDHRQEPEGVWRRRWVQNILPLGSSLALHLAIIVVGYATFQTVKVLVKVEQPQVITPEGQIDTSALPDSKNPLMNSDVSVPFGDIRGVVVPSALDLEPSKVHRGLAGLAAEGDISTSEIGVGPNSRIGVKGSYGQLGTGDDGGGPLRFGSPDGSGSGVIFNHVPGHGRKIMFICDASGSMLSVFGRLKVELKESIGSLTPGQQFNVVFFSDEKYTCLSKDSLLVANSGNKAKAFDFINNAVATGGTDPVPAINFAMSQHPELTFVLTDGFDQIANFDTVINAFSNNASTINCIYLQSAEDPKLLDVLQTIATQHHGTLKTIAKSDF